MHAPIADLEKSVLVCLQAALVDPCETLEPIEDVFEEPSERATTNGPKPFIFPFKGRDTKLVL
jgi:hypothetical protein